MSNVHSVQLGNGIALGAGLNTLYTCPSGKRTIVKSVYLRNATAAAVVSAIAVTRSTGGTINFFVPLAATPAAGSTVFLDLWMVLNAGDVLKVGGAAGSGVDALASGAELTL